MQSANLPQALLLYLHNGKPNGAKRPRNTSLFAWPPNNSRFTPTRAAGAAVVNVILEFALEDTASSAFVAEQDVACIFGGTSQLKEIVPVKPLMDMTSIIRFPDWPGVIVIGGTFAGRLKSPGEVANNGADTAKLVVAMAEA